jgi:hypothetical protein
MTTVKVTKNIDVSPQVVCSTISAGDGLDKWLPVITDYSGAIDGLANFLHKP